MSAKKKLGRATTVAGKTYLPGDELPDDVAEKITNPKAWIPDDEPTEADADPDRPAGTASGHRLAKTVTVGGRSYGPEDPLPDDVAERITNPKAWEGGELPNLTAKKTAEPKPTGDIKTPAKSTPAKGSSSTSA